MKIEFTNLVNLIKKLINEIKIMIVVSKLDDNTDNDLGLNQFNLLIKYLSNIFNGKRSINNTFIKREN